MLKANNYKDKYENADSVKSILTSKTVFNHFMHSLDPATCEKEKWKHSVLLIQDAA